MLTYDLSRLDGPLYRRICELVKRDVLDGRLAPGSKIPSKRTLARNLGVSAITVENAYGQLLAEGFLRSAPRRGYFVADVAPGKIARRAAPATLDVKVPSKDDDWRFDFSSNRTESGSFPFSLWAKSLRENMTRRKKELLEPSPSAGVPELRRAIAEHLASFRGMAVDPNQLVVGSGAEYLYGLLVQLLGRDRIYCVENPGYRRLRMIYESLGAECRLARMDARGVMVDDLRALGADAAHLSPTHHFPTGVTTPISRRFEILAWANEAKNRYVIEDDYDVEFRVNGRPLPSLQSVDPEKVAYVNTFSKTLASTIRISYMALPVELANRFYEKLSFYSCSVSTFEQYALATFIERGYFEKHINRMRLHYIRKRANVLAAIESRLPKGVFQVVENDSGLHFILKIKTKKSDAEIKETLRDQGIKIAAISDFDMLDPEDNQSMFLVNYSSLDEERLDWALERLKEAGSER